MSDATEVKHLDCTAEEASNIVSWLEPVVASTLVFDGSGLEYPEQFAEDVEGADKTKPKGA
jgi:hypothetical protein